MLALTWQEVTLIVSLAGIIAGVLIKLWMPQNQAEMGQGAARVENMVRTLADKLELRHEAIMARFATVDRLTITIQSQLDHHQAQLDRLMMDRRE